MKDKGYEDYLIDRYDREVRVFVKMLDYAIRQETNLTIEKLIEVSNVAIKHLKKKGVDNESMQSLW